MFSSDSLIDVLQANPSISSNIIRKALLFLTLNGQNYQSVPSLLFETCIVFKIKSQQEITQLQIKFNFELMFEVGYAQISDPSKRQISFIKLEREGISLTLKSQQSPKQLLIWREFFQKTLKQKGFHELFKPLKKIGRGGFASVYLVEKKQDNKKYAVKAFSKQSLYSEEKGKESLIFEIEMMRKFNHKNLMKLYGVYETDHSVYLVVELLQGGQLLQRLGKDYRTTSLEIKIMMKGLLQGLEAMHKRGVMHRDIKPENILFRKQNDCDCVIADFGLAEIASSEEYMFVRCGTPGFVAPEVANIRNEDAKYTCACDLFSVGIIFHMLLLKRSPFPALQFNETLRQNRLCNFHFQTAQYKQLPQASLDLLQRLLEVNPLKRITASESLKHGFFQNQFSFWENNRKNHLLKIEPRFLKENSANYNYEASSTQVKTKNMMHLPAIREDSCLKFKMKQNVLTGKLEQVQFTPFDRQSPLIAKRIENASRGESRFKRLTYP